MPEKLANYISTMQQQGIDDDQIKENLRNAGWNDDVVNKALGKKLVLTAKIEEKEFIERRALIWMAYGNSGANAVALLISMIPVWIVIILSDWIIEQVIKISLLSLPLAMPIYVLLSLSLTGYIVACWKQKHFSYQLKSQYFYQKRIDNGERVIITPYEKIDNVIIKKNIFYKIFKICRIQIQTAGIMEKKSKNHFWWLEDIKKAEKLKEELLNRAQVFKAFY